MHAEPTAREQPKLQMSEPTDINWKKTLVDVYERAARDPEYRTLCQNDPMAAIKEVSDIELPPGSQVVFATSREQYVHSYMLPDLINTDDSQDNIVDSLVKWATFCTGVPTTL